MKVRIPRGLKKKLEADLGRLSPRQAGQLYLIYLHAAAGKRQPAGAYPPLQKLIDAWQQRVDRAGQGQGPEGLLREARYRRGFLLLAEIANAAQAQAQDKLLELAFASQNILLEFDYHFLVDTAGLVAHRVTRELIDQWPRPASDQEYDRLVAWAENEALWALPALAVEMAAGAMDTGENLPEGQAMAAEILPRLIAEVEAGKLAGGRAVVLEGCVDLVLLDRAGQIPAWAALRATWRRWLYQHFVYMHETPVADPDYLNGRYALWDAEGEIDAGRLLPLVQTFVRDCRARIWGRHLARQIDFAALGRFLVAYESPLLADQAAVLGLAELGRVDWESFSALEGDGSERWTPVWAATVGSLALQDPGGGGAKRRFWGNLVREQYYPTAAPQEQRRALQRNVELLEALMISHRPFSSRREKESDREAPAAMPGVTLATPLEETVQALEAALAQVATFKEIYQVLSAMYFGGLPLLLESQTTMVWLVEDRLSQAGRTLQRWLDRLADPIWQVNLATLRLVEPGADVAAARESAARLVKASLVSARLKEGDFDLGQEDPPSPAKTGKGAPK